MGHLYQKVGKWSLIFLDKVHSKIIEALVVLPRAIKDPSQSLSSKISPFLQISGSLHSEMLEEASGSVAMVGGFSGSQTYDAIYRLAHAKAEEWQRLPGDLFTSRSGHVAFLVPDRYTNCTSTS